MAHSVKRFFKKILSEGEISGLDIDQITDVKVSEDEKNIEFHIKMLDGRTPVLFVGFEEFVKWATENQGNYSDMFKEFVTGYLSISDVEEPLQEIIDDSGDIMGDEDLPSNSTNSMVGANNKWDTSRFASSAVPNHRNFYNGPFGGGYIVW